MLASSTKFSCTCTKKSVIYKFSENTCKPAGDISLNDDLEQITANTHHTNTLPSQDVHGVSQGWTSNRSPSDSPGHLALVQTNSGLLPAGHTSAKTDGNGALLPKLLKVIHSLRRESDQIISNQCSTIFLANHQHS